MARLEVMEKEASHLRKENLDLCEHLAKFESPVQVREPTEEEPEPSTKHRKEGQIDI